MGLKAFFAARLRKMFPIARHPRNMGKTRHIIMRAKMLCSRVTRTINQFTGFGTYDGLYEFAFFAKFSKMIGKDCIVFACEASWLTRASRQKNSFFSERAGKNDQNTGNYLFYYRSPAMQRAQACLG